MSRRNRRYKVCRHWHPLATTSEALANVLNHYYKSLHIWQEHTIGRVGGVLLYWINKRLIARIEGASPTYLEK